MNFAIWKCLPALALFSMLLPNAAHSQIKYTDIDPDTTVVAPANWDMVEFFLDVDRDGNDDFRFVHFAPTGDDENRAVEFYFVNGGGDLAVICGQQKQPLALEQGHLISELSPITTWISASSGQFIGAAFLNRNDRLNEPWEDVTDRYLGIAKQIAGQWHYGWIRLDVPLDASWFTVKDYALNMTPGEEILAGAGTPSSIDPAELNDFAVDVYGHGKSIVVEFKQLSSVPRQLNVYSLLGAKVSGRSLENTRTTIPMSNNPAGTYIAVIKDGVSVKSFLVQIW